MPSTRDRPEDFHGGRLSRLKAVPLATLGFIALVNYAAQVPYYFHQYYPAQPFWPGTFLLALTLVWFLLGFSRYLLGLRHGYWILVAFLIVQILFYGQSVLLSLFTGGRGGIVAQLGNPDPFLVVVFGIGYLNFVAAMWALVWLVVSRRRAAPVGNAGSARKAGGDRR